MTETPRYRNGYSDHPMTETPRDPKAEGVSSVQTPRLFITEEYGVILLPVHDYSFNQARTAAAEYARERFDLWGRSRYTGKQTTALHDHDEPWPGEIETDCRPTCTMESVWTFDIYEVPTP